MCFEDLMKCLFHELRVLLSSSIFLIFYFLASRRGKGARFDHRSQVDGERRRRWMEERRGFANVRTKIERTGRDAGDKRRKLERNPGGKRRTEKRAEPLRSFVFRGDRRFEIQLQRIGATKHSAGRNFGQTSYQVQHSLRLIDYWLSQCLDAIKHFYFFVNSVHFQKKIYTHTHTISDILSPFFLRSVLQVI